jgi:hypothetical protein
LVGSISFLRSFNCSRTVWSAGSSIDQISNSTSDVHWSLEHLLSHLL